MFQAREPRLFPAEEVRGETPTDGSQVGPIAENDADGHALTAVEPLKGGGAVLAELARLLSTTSRRRIARRPPSAPTPQLGRLRGALRPLWPRAAPGGPADPCALSQGLGDLAQPLASRSFRQGQSDSRSRRFSGDSPRIASRHATARVDTQRNTRSCDGLSAVTPRARYG